ncbi:RCC1-like domain-containing protein [Nannocystis pusilla]|uniref:RCC1-like domain-containing protein n=1 Tax=Nannocystis pusilla TaxID=889268 RepID=UPI003B797AC6
MRVPVRWDSRVLGRRHVRPARRRRRDDGGAAGAGARPGRGGAAVGGAVPDDGSAGRWDSPRLGPRVGPRAAAVARLRRAARVRGGGDGVARRAPPEPYCAAPATLPVADANQVVVGQLHACALTDDGQVLCWGSNTFGGVGDGGDDDRLQPRPVAW